MTFASAIAAAGPMHVWPAPASASEMLFDQASGSSSRRTVWPVGAVSKITRSKPAPPAGGERGSRRVEEVGEAVERGDLGGARPGELLLHDPHDLGREDLADRRQRPVGVLGGRRSGSISIAHRFGTPAIGVIAWPIGCSNTSARFDAGSVVTIRTRRAGVGLGDGGRAGHRRLADAALAGEEEELGHEGVLSRGLGAPAQALAASSVVELVEGRVGVGLDDAPADDGDRQHLELALP